MRRATIEKRVAEIAELSDKIMELSKDSNVLGYMEQATEVKVLKLERQQSKLISKAIRQLHAAGLCESLDGLTDADTKRPEFDGIDRLWELSDGSWC